ncbi:MAG: NitT/TauT family transport system substrate-binding protein [Solirubrobacteraceae bacterium]
MSVCRRRAVGLAILATAATAIAACGSDSDSGASTQGAASPATNHIKIALEYTPGADNAAVFIAEQKGWFKRDGLDVEVVPFGKTRSDTLAATGRVDFAIAASEDDVLLAHARKQPITAVLALAQHDPAAIGVRADGKISRPKDLDGTVYGGFGSAKEPIILKATIRADGGKGDFKQVVLGTAAYKELYSKKVESALFYTYSDAVEAKLASEDVKLFEPRDFGLPDQYGPTVVVNNGYLAKHRAVAQAFVRDLKAGLEYELAHPDEAADIVVKRNSGLGLDSTFMRASTKAFAGGYIRPAAGAIGTMTPQMWRDRGAFYVQHGLVQDEDGSTLHGDLDYSTIFTNNLLGT